MTAEKCPIFFRAKTSARARGNNLYKIVFVLLQKVSDCDVAFMPENHCYAVSCFSDKHCETTPATEETFNVQLVKVRRVVIPTPDDNNNSNNNKNINNNNNSEEEFIRSKVVTAEAAAINNNKPATSANATATTKSNAPTNAGNNSAVKQENGERHFL